MLELNQQKLNEHIAMEQWERRLTPLFLFKGTKPYHIRKRWNIAYGMFLTECDAFGLGARTIGGSDTGHLCGAHVPPSSMAMHTMFSRLRGCRQLTDSFGKAFTQYVEWLHPGPCVLDRVPLATTDYREGVTAWWRVRAATKCRVWRQADIKPADRAYPYIQHVHAHSMTAEQKLLFDVHKQLPNGLPYEIRGDLCQDLIVAVLSGETTVANIPDVVAKYARDARKILPDRWRNVSLDDILPGTDDFRLLDTLTTDVCDDHIHDHAHLEEEFSFLDALSR